MNKCDRIAKRTIMQKKITYLLFFLLLRQSFPVFSQGDAAGGTIKKENERFLLALQSLSNDSAIIIPITHYFETGINEIHQSIRSDKKLKQLDKEFQA